jgi:hypothetical protein
LILAVSTVAVIIWAALAVAVVAVGFLGTLEIVDRRARRKARDACTNATPPVATPADDAEVGKYLYDALHRASTVDYLFDRAIRRRFEAVLAKADEKTPPLGAAAGCGTSSSEPSDSRAARRPSSGGWISELLAHLPSSG